MGNVSFLAAFIAGLFSISSPCVLPLIPIFLTHVASVAAGETARKQQIAVMLNAAAYVLGFSLVFIALGAALGVTGELAGSLNLLTQNKVWLIRIGGVLLMILGLHQMGVIRIPILYRNAHVHLDGGKPGTVGSSFVIGLSFGAGWSPCIGPILGVILTMAASQANTGRAVSLLSVYSLGMAIPFLLVALTFGSVQRFMRRINQHLHLVELTTGAIMITIGAIMILGVYELLMIQIIQHAPWLPWEPELT